MYPLKAELKHRRVATTNRIGEGLKSSNSEASVMTPSFSGRGHSLAVAILQYDNKELDSIRFKYLSWYCVYMHQLHHHICGLERLVRSPMFQN